MGKKLYINSGNTMILKDEQNSLGGYDSITINTGSLIISNKILTDLKEKNVKFSYNSGSALFVDAVGELLVLSDKAIIDENSDIEGKIIVSRGSVVVKALAKENLKKVESIYAKKIFLPKNISLGEVPNLNVNTIITCDSGAEVIFGDKDINMSSVKSFMSNKNYYIDGTVTLFDNGSADYLKDNNINIECSSLKIYEDILNSMGDMIKLQKLEIIPTDYKYISRGSLNESTIYQYGEKLYISDSFKIEKKFHDELKKFESIIVNGKLTIEKSLLEDFFKIGTAGNIRAFEGKIIEINGKMDLSHDFFAPLMEANSKITLDINGILTVNDDVTKEDVSCISNINVNGKIKCSDTVKAYLLDVLSGDYTFSNTKENESADNFMDSLNDPDAEVINTGTYTLV